MRSSRRGKSTSSIEVTNISQFGFWLFFKGQEYFLPFDRFPWFKDASIGQITNVEVFGKGNFHWPDLDVDLSTAIIEHPEKYKLLAR
jgi:hypothetical protein